MTTAELLAESVDVAQVRQRNAFDRAAGEFGDRIVLFGAGTLGQKIGSALRRRGITPLAFADNNRELHGTAFSGVPVLSPTAAAARFGSDAIFVVTIFRGAGDEGMGARLAHLAALGCRRIASFLPLAWKWPEELLPHYAVDLPSRLLAHAQELSVLDAAWADPLSRETFRQQLAWRLRGDFPAPSRPAPDQYFPRDLFALRTDERFVDGGAFDGDTLRVLGPNFERAWAFEPDPANAARLRATADGRVMVAPYALGSEPGETCFKGTGTIASAIEAAGGIKVRVETLDALLADAEPTFIKLDIEGGELAALTGARTLLTRCRPLVAACLYHEPNHLWQIPQLLRQALAGHPLYLRVHQHDGFELVAYAIPQERLLKP